MSDLEILYQQVILDHAREKHGYGVNPSASAVSHQVNPTCGDEITLAVTLDDDEKITGVTWEGQGCSISTASASLLSDLVASSPNPEQESFTHSRADLRDKIAAFRELVHSKGALTGDEDLLGDAIALGGVSRYVTRVKCAMLPWVALEDALIQCESVVRGTN